MARSQRVMPILTSAALLAVMMSGCPETPATPPESGSQTAASGVDASPADEPKKPEKRVEYSVETSPEELPFQESESGLKYRILRPGDGHVADRDQVVICYYRGWLDDGTEFVNVYKTGESQNFPMPSMVPGFREAMSYVKAGGKIELIVPPDLGFGEAGSPPTIPPDATLHFEIDVINTF